MKTLQLTDFGAEVIKPELPEGDPLRHCREEGVSVLWKVYGRNNKSVRLDLRTDEGKALLHRLLPTAHGLIEGFRPGIMEAAEFGPDRLLAANPKLVVVRIFGFGQTGPYSPRPGFGSLVEGMCGFAAKNSFADKPPALPKMALADMVAGIQGASSTMVALREAEREGDRGQVVDLSLLESLNMTFGPDAAVHRITVRPPQRSGNRVSLTVPRNVYVAVDGAWLALSALTQKMTERLFCSLDWPELIEDPRFRTNADRLQHVEELDAIAQDFVGRHTLGVNLAFLIAAQVTVGPVYDPAGFGADPHVQARGVLVEMDDAELGSLPMHAVCPRLSSTPGALRLPVPDLGKHDGEVLPPASKDGEELPRTSRNTGHNSAPADPCLEG